MSNDKEIILDYQNGMMIQDIEKKHSVSNTNFYRILKRNNISTDRSQVDFGDLEIFKNNYQTKTIDELVVIYGVPFKSIRDKARKISVKRPESLISRNKSILTKEMLYEDYVVNRLTPLQISHKYQNIGGPKRCMISSLLRRYGLVVRRNNVMVAEDYKNGMSRIDLKNKYNTGSSDLTRILKKCKVPTRRDTSKYGSKSIFTKELLYQEYIVNNIFSSEIAEKYKNAGGPTKPVIARLLREYNIVKDPTLIKIKQLETRIKNHGYGFGGNYGKTENDIREWLKSFGLNFPSNPTILDGKEIDLYNEELKLGIEYCGLRWHCEESEKGRQYHNNKRKLAESKGVRLITIFEDEWMNKREYQVKSFLKSVIGKNSRKIAARKCEVKEIDKKIASEFIEKYHIQGEHQTCNYQVGIFYKEELVGVMTLSPHHRDKNIPILDRLCFKEDVTVQGGANRLFKQCIVYCTQNNISKLISWSDNRWSMGNVYEKLGFILEEELGTDYSYVNLNNQGQRLSKQSQKKKTTKCPDGMTESEWAIERGLSKIWDCGKKRWVYNIS